MELRDAAALAALEGFPGRLLQEARHLAAGDEETAPCPSLERLLGRLGRSASASALAAARRRADRSLAQAAALGIQVISWTAPRFSTRLATIPDPPPVLWLRGRPAALDTLSIAVVGSRAASPYALEVAGWLGSKLAGCGVTVISGLARGVDSAAHRGALTAGRTVAVLGSSVEIVYPPEHADLAEAVMQDGALVSEFPPGTGPRREHSPQRNRIISGLAEAVVVVEASARSGSLITARCALDQGRDVMAVPGTVFGGRNRGSHALLKDGAKVVEHVDDILEEIGAWARRGPASVVDPPAPADALLACLTEGEACDLDELTERSGLDSAMVLTRLLDLQLQGAVRRIEGGRFVRVIGNRKMVT